MLLLALEGHSQREIALAEAVSESAVSQAFARGVGAVRDAQDMLAALDKSLPSDRSLGQ
jgi:DNA-directed RNA polymerase specialized sigma24 family protein